MSTRVALVSAFGLLAGCIGDDPPLATTATELQASCNDGMDDSGELCPGDAQAVIAAAGMRAITVVDFNNDGLLDVAAIRVNQTYVRLRTAAGWGATSIHTIGGADLRDIAAGDLDADGDGDLVVTDFAGDRIAIYTNNGTGMLAAPAFTAAGNGPTRVLAARLDAGLSFDVVTLDSLAGTATLLLGGTFFIAAYPIGAAPDIGVIRCNADAWPDLVYSSGTDAAHLVRARPGTAAGSFGAPVNSAVPLPPVLGDPTTNPLAITGGLLDGDGFGDVVVTADGSLVVPAHSNGACGFVPEVLSHTWAYSLRPDMRDVDSDGFLDLVAPHANAAVSAVFGDGTGQFPIGASVLLTELYAAAPPTVADIAPADITGDGNLDYLVATSAGVDLWRGVP